MKLKKFSIGVGDRFGREGVPQLRAVGKAWERGVEVVPVWNKSNREHTLIGTTPEETRWAAEAAVAAAGWQGPWHLDADHIGMKTVERFLPHCDFFTIDVADFIGQPPASGDEEAALRKALAPVVGRRFGELGVEEPVSEEQVGRFLRGYGAALAEAARIYRQIAAVRGEEGFIAEVSTDEAETPQSPLDLFLILGVLAGLGVRVQTIAPKFTGRFNKGVDYVGDVGRFAGEFERDLVALRLAVAEFGLPEGLKLSVHSGSDKFSLYGPMRELVGRHGAGLHLKTAGTTWLEELTGLALAGGGCLAVAVRIYGEAFGRIEELSKPYATVIDIDRSQLPRPEEVAGWDGEEFAAALRHNAGEPRFNPHLRQLLHVSFKVAAEMGGEFLAALEEAREEIAGCVTENLWERHIRPLFVG